jgi:hypothetical protein
MTKMTWLRISGVQCQVLADESGTEAARLYNTINGWQLHRDGQYVKTWRPSKSLQRAQEAVVALLAAEDEKVAQTPLQRAREVLDVARRESVEANARATNARAAYREALAVVQDLTGEVDS